MKRMEAKLKNEANQLKKIIDNVKEDLKMHQMAICESLKILLSSEYLLICRKAIVSCAENIL